MLTCFDESDVNKVGSGTAEDDDEDDGCLTGVSLAGVDAVSDDVVVVVLVVAVVVEMIVVSSFFIELGDELDRADDSVAGSPWPSCPKLFTPNVTRLCVSCGLVSSPDGSVAEERKETKIRGGVIKITREMNECEVIFVCETDADVEGQVKTATESHYMLPRNSYKTIHRDPKTTAYPRNVLAP